MHKFVGRIAVSLLFVGLAGQSLAQKPNPPSDGLVQRDVKKRVNQGYVDSPLIEGRMESKSVEILGKKERTPIEYLVMARSTSVKNNRPSPPLQSFHHTLRRNAQIFSLVPVGVRLTQNIECVYRYSDGGWDIVGYKVVGADAKEFEAEMDKAKAKINANRQ